MADSNRYSFARLGNKNYANDWDLRMEAILVRKGLLGVVQIVVSDTNSDGTEKTVAEMDIELRTLIATRDTTKMAEGRAELCVHRTAGFATSLALRCQFLTAKKLDSETMEDWIGHVQSMVLRMEYTGIVVTDQDKILVFTMGLPTTYEAVIINFDATPPDALTVEHEMREQSSTSSTPTDTDHDPNNVAFAARRIVASGDHNCYFCDKKGHFKSDCPERLRWEQSKKKATETAAAVNYDSDDYDRVW
ncbi:hypothetical protein DFH08DRAFT_972881 [Mycena albidolilacea]|uniref:CCHC-type domain-containing protein n=1 Tax=Mycena albidolilacea TaxID=1033008 RepID=A0AAD6ZB05_9AGAR|nr:hypothetical protein DFH08DRAFT_972881 [Mycena albidolilacea]